MADNRKNSKGPVNNDGPGIPRIDPPIAGPEYSGKDSTEKRLQNRLQDRLQRYAKLVAEQKSQMMKVDKQKLIDIVFKQNSIITQQSNQMIDLVNLVNELDAPSNNKESQVSVQKNLQKNINILKNRNELCKEADEMRQEGARIYSSSVKIQFVLFILFIMVMFWLLYHYMSFNE